MKKLVILVILFMSTFIGIAQIKIYKSDPQKQITLDKKVDSLNLIHYFGNPDKCNTYYDEEYHDGQVTDYYYGPFIFTCVDGRFDNFLIKGPEPSYTVGILDKYTVRVGDSIEDFIRKTSDDAYFRMRGKDMMMFLKHDGTIDDLPLVFSFDADGKITSIWFSN